MESLFMNTISVIVPCYNVAPYLERCINSVVNQTYHNLDIILVDDGSTDDTGRVCDRLAQTDNRIRVVHKENGGLSDARNAGIDVAQGDFLSFVDGDDYLELDAYEVMVLEMQSPNVSLVSAGIIAEDVDGKINAIMSKEKIILNREEAFINLLGAVRTIGQSSCNKLFRKSLFENLRYKNGIINEDMEILPKILDRCQQVILLNKPIYHYIKRAGSITVSEFSNWKYEGVRIATDTRIFCQKKHPQLVPYAYYYEMDSFFKMFMEVVNSSNRREFCKQEHVLRTKVVKTYFKCMQWKFIRMMYGNKIKNMAIMAFLGIELTERLVKFKQRIKGIGK